MKKTLTNIDTVMSYIVILISFAAISPSIGYAQIQIYDADRLQPRPQGLLRDGAREKRRPW
jgi:hypothetical protein